MIRHISIVFFVLVASGWARVSGDRLSERVQLYLLNAGVEDPNALLRGGKVVVAKLPGQYVAELRKWDIAGIPEPTTDTLPALEEADVALTPVAKRKKVNGKWVLKTQQELDDELNATPEGKRKTKRAAVRTQLRTELTTAGFTNVNYTVDDVNDWLGTVTLTPATEKKITRLLSHYEGMAREPVKVDTNE